jgi:hypothetical protein
LNIFCGVLQVLLRALRDFNLGKLTSDDTSIFMGLLNDLFPKTLELVPRAVEKEFESKVWLGSVSKMCLLPQGQESYCLASVWSHAFYGHLFGLPGSRLVSCAIRS